MVVLEDDLVWNFDMKFNKTAIDHAKILNIEMKELVKNLGYTIYYVPLPLEAKGTFSDEFEYDNNIYFQICITKIINNSFRYAWCVNITEEKERERFEKDFETISDYFFEKLYAEIYLNNITIQKRINKEIKKRTKDDTRYIFKTLKVNHVLPEGNFTIDENGIEFEQLGFGIKNKQGDLIAYCGRTKNENE